MNRQNVVNLTKDIIQRYYQNDTKPFMDYVDKKVLWYGPATGQFLSGKKAILDAWANESHSLTFSLGNMQLDYTSSHDAYCEVMASFPVTTHYPSGDMITMDQIIHITWCERKIKDVKEKQPRMLVIHISDLYQKHMSDNIYPVHFNQVYRGYMPVSESGKCIYFQGTDSFDLYLLPDTILWVDSINNGRSSIIHTDNAEYHVRATTIELEKEHPDFLIRCHRCHLVNPRHIVCIKRFAVTLSNGKEIPVPEKKYTAFKKTVHDCATTNNTL